MLYKSGLLLAILCVSQLVPSKATAAIFKCVGADGEVSYNQTPCQAEQKTAKVLSVSSANKTQYDCRIANNFARRTAMGMRSGLSSGDIFDSYGGIDAIPRTAIGVINYVYSHKDNVNTGPQRIAALSAARCSSGSYGDVGCDDFPYGFISDLGGCDAATKSTMTNSKPVVAASENEPSTDHNGTTAAMGVRTATDAGTSSTDCHDQVQAQLSELFAKMRSGQSASAQGKLQDQKKSLQNQLDGC